MRATLAKLVQQHPVLNEIDAAFMDTRGVHIALAAGDELYQSGDGADSLFFLLRGALQIEYPDVGERRGRAVAIVMSPGVLGECQTIYRRPWTGTGVALSELDVFSMDRAALLDMLRAFPLATEQLYRELAWQFLGAIDRRRAEPEREPRDSLACYLSDLDRVFDSLDHGYEGWIPVTQGDLGRACGLRRETVARIIADWKRAGVIETGRGRIRLAEAVRPAPGYPSQLSFMHPNS